MQRLLLALVLALGLSALASASGSAQEQPVAANPCADSLYQVLRGKALDKLSDREYEYFMQREKACTDHMRLAALMSPQPTAGPRPSSRPISSSARSQANTMGGVDIFVRNTSDRPLIVNSVNITDCQGIRQTSCGMHSPKMRIQPGQERRVFTIRTSSESNSYRYSYHVSEAEPEQ